MARRQHAVFSLSQLVELGLSARVVQLWAAGGRLHRIHRGVYSLVPPELLSPRGRYMAAVLACGAGAVLSHRDAADLHGLCRSDRPRIDVTVPGQTCRRRRGITIHGSVTLTAADVTVVHGIPCTTRARTHLDLAAVVSLAQTEQALNQAQVMGVLHVAALDDQLRRNPHHRGAGRLTAALKLYRERRAPTESRLEEDFLALLRSSGRPEPERQVVLDLEDGEPPIRVDFMWRAEKVIIETDGHRHHGTRRAFEEDRHRDQRLAKARWNHTRVTWRQVHREPAGILALVDDLLAP